MIAVRTSERRELWLIPLILAGAVAAVLGFVAMGVG